MKDIRNQFAHYIDIKDFESHGLKVLDREALLDAMQSGRRGTAGPRLRRVIHQYQDSTWA